MFRGEFSVLDVNVTVVVQSADVYEIRGAVLDLVEFNDSWRGQLEEEVSSPRCTGPAGCAQPVDSVPSQ